MPDQSPILTLGYNSRGLTDFTALLRAHAIAFLIDIRSTPWDSERPEFSQDALAQHLRGLGVRYVFMGDALGAQPDDPECYVGGRISLSGWESGRIFYRAWPGCKKPTIKDCGWR